MEQILYQILGLVGAGFIAWILYKYIKGKPEQLNRENLSKSFSSMGILALMLIGFVMLLILMLNYT